MICMALKDTKVLLTTKGLTISLHMIWYVLHLYPINQSHILLDSDLAHENCLPVKPAASKTLRLSST